MTRRVRCEDLGILGCSFAAQGETAGEVLGEVTGHLEKEHGIHVPEATDILEGRVNENDLGKGARLVVQRLRDVLNIKDNPQAPDVDTPITPPPSSHVRGA
jgi:predicted small metal-binding protein